MNNDIRYIIETYPFLLECYPEHILKMMSENYRTKKRTHLIDENSFTFAQFTLKLYELGYINSDVHQIRRLDTTKKFDESNIYLKKADGMQRKLKNMSKIIKKTDLRKIKIKINDEKPFRKFA